MTIYRVGQRVKLVFPHNPENYGLTGVIREIPIPTRYKDALGMAEVFVDWDDGTKDAIPDALGRKFATSFDQIVPLSDSNDLVSWESMRSLWVPDRYKEQA